MTRRKTVRVQFVNFWPGFDYRWFVARLPLVTEHYDFVVSDEPDYVFFSVWRHQPFPKGRYQRIFFSGENVRFDLSQCDWAFSTEYDEELQHPRHLRFPLYLLLGAGENLVKRGTDAEAVLKEKTRFCNFVYSRDVPLRTDFLKRLSRYKRIDAPGRCMNNMGREVIGERESAEWYSVLPEFMRKYKFTIAFENASYPGYTTEKIYHPMLANSIPIYWGNPLVSRDFNPGSFLSLHDFENRVRSQYARGLWRGLANHPVFSSLFIMPKAVNLLIKRIVEIDQNDELYEAYVNQPWYHGNQPSKYVDRQRILSRFREILG